MLGDPRDSHPATARRRPKNVHLPRGTATYPLDDASWIEAIVLSPARAVKEGEQVVSNLVGNALKYTPAGGRVAVRVRPDGDAAVLEGEDTGAGIPSDLIGKVFDLFVQGDRALDRAQGGLGLGLTLVRALVTMHGEALGSAEATDPER